MILLREIVLLQIDLLREVVLLSNRFVIHDISMQVIDQIRDVDWCVIEIINQSEMISADSNDILS